MCDVSCKNKKTGKKIDIFFVQIWQRRISQFFDSSRIFSLCIRNLCVYPVNEKKAE